MSARPLLAPFLAGLLLVPFLACEDGTPPIPCMNIPPGGCPKTEAESCRDRSCRTIYLCQPGGSWGFDHDCPLPTDGGADAAASDAAAEASARLNDGSIDAPPGAGGGPGCADLETPDCPLATALSCPSGCCGCENLFVCQSGAWAAWGSCDADGGIVQR